MSSDFVKAQITKRLELLASSAADQRAYLERLRSAPSADELALELEDFIPMLAAAVREGVISEKQATAIEQVSDLTASFSGSENTALWDVHQLDTAWHWTEVRRLAGVALQMLRDSE